MSGIFLKKQNRTPLRFVCFALCLVCLFASRAGALTAPELSAEGEKALIYSVDFDRVLWSNAPDDKIAPASFTKIMTSALAFEFLAEHPGTYVTVSEYAATRSSGTRLGLKTGEVLPMEELLSAMALTGANDAAIAVAETVAGSEVEFVSKMNKKAAELGMENTYFANPTGIDNSAMYSTLSDIAKLCGYAYRFNSYMVTASEPSHTIPETALSKERRIDNANKLVVPSKYSGYYTENALGFCAGGTQASGLCVATSFMNSSLSYVILITGGKYQNEVYSTFTDARTLIRFTSDSFSLHRVIMKDQVVGQMNVKLAKNSDVVALVASENVQTLLPKDYNTSLIRIECSYYDEFRDGLTAPVDGGMKVGELSVKYGATLLGKTSIVTQRALELSWLESAGNKIGLFFQKTWVVTTLKIILAVIILAVAVIALVMTLRHRKKTAQQRKALKKYLKNERRRFAEEKKKYHREAGIRREKRKAVYRRVKKGIESYREEKRREEMKAALRAQAARREKLRREAQLRQNREAQNQKPPARPGDEYYNR